MAYSLALRSGFQTGTAVWVTDASSTRFVSEVQRRGYTPATCASVIAAQPTSVAYAAPPTPRAEVEIRPAPSGSGSAIPMQRQGGTFLVPVTINNAITLGFILDSGAADVSIPADVFLTLMRTGTIRNTDFLGSQNYQLADGSVVPSTTFRIRTLKIGDQQVENVKGSVASPNGPLLLGQSFLGRFKSWSIDNQRHALVLN
jgi:predicted aspartyl protease